MNKSYGYYAERVLGLAAENHTVDHTDEEELLAYAEECAEWLVLDEDKLKDTVEKHNYFNSASVIGGI